MNIQSKRPPHPTSERPPPPTSHRVKSPCSIIHAAYQITTTSSNNDVAIPLVALQSLIDSILSQNQPTDAVKLATVFTPTSSSPNPFGDIQISNVVKRKLFDLATTLSDENATSPLQRCTIAVKPPTHTLLDLNSKKNSKGFGTFVQYLHSNNLVALLACDSSGRVGFIVPSSSTTKKDGCFSAHLYYALAGEFIPWARECYYNATAPTSGGENVIVPSDGEVVRQAQLPSILVQGRDDGRGYEGILLPNNPAPSSREFMPPSSTFNNRARFRRTPLHLLGSGYYHGRDNFGSGMNGSLLVC